MINAERRRSAKSAPIPEMINFAGVAFDSRASSWRCAAHGPDGKLPNKPVAAGVWSESRLRSERGSSNEVEQPTRRPT